MKKLIVPAIICYSLFTVYSSLSFGAVLLDRVVATVNNEVITWSELRRKIDLDGVELLKGLTAEEREKKIREFERAFLNGMVDLSLQLQEAFKTGLSVSESEADNAIADIKAKYNLTEENLAETLESEGLTLNEYRTRLKEQILLSKVVKYEVNNSIVISDDEIKGYYELNKGKFRGKERVRISQIFFPGDVNSVTQKTEIDKKAENIIKRIEKGEDFGKIAKEISSDTNNEYVGDLGYVSRGSVLKEIEEVAFKLEIGEVSIPFWEPAGLHIIKLEDRMEGSDVDEVRNEIKEILFDEMFKIKYDDWVKTLRERAYIEINL